MCKLLFAKSGIQENPVTEAHDLSIDKLKSIVGSHKLRHLGQPADELPALGEPDKLDGVRGANSVVILISTTEANSLGCAKAGFYLVEDLNPADIEL